ncbi:MAG TPA: histidine kinase [Microbacterium sp.]|nr:histidine kinase [Microbacterium sp.]
MTSPVRALWDAPAASPPPPRRVWRDWVLVAVLPPLVLFEALVRPDVPWRWGWAVVLVVLVPTLLWRRTRPLPMFALAFALGTLLGIVNGTEPDLFSTAYFLILVYALMRWASGRAIVIGAAILLTGTAVSSFSASGTAASGGPVTDAVGGLAVLVATSTLGITFRWRASARARELEAMRLREREDLARDLHDTVAHHVSAIAIQAQAGTAVAATDPAAAADVLRVIEGEASRTLDEMRSIVRLLRREDAAAERAPSAGVADIARLTQTEGLTVDVQVAGDAHRVPPAVGAAVYRIAQEAVTNARRHARGAGRVEVRVEVGPDGIHLDVRDDGDDAAAAAAGYGITGMRERAVLLGGTFDAGPIPGGGWRVTAALPLTGGAT